MSYSYAVHYVQERWWDDPTARHGDGTTYSYADGHAEYWKWKGIDTVKMGRDRDRSHPGNYTPQTDEGFRDLYRLQEATFGRLRELRPDIKVLLSSGYDKDEVAGRFTGDRPEGCIQKPFRTADLVARVREVLGS